MPTPAARRRPLHQQAIGAARLGYRVGENAVGFGRQAWKAGEKGYTIGKKTFGVIAAERERRGKTHSDIGEEGTLKPPTAEEKLSEIRGNKLERMLERNFPEEVVEELGRLLEEAEEHEAGARDLHLALARFFEERYPGRDAVNVLRIKKWIRIILRSRGMEFADYANNEPGLRV